MQVGGTSLTEWIQKPGWDFRLGTDSLFFKAPTLAEAEKFAEQWTDYLILMLRHWNLREAKIGFPECDFPSGDRPIQVLASMRVGNFINGKKFIMTSALQIPNSVWIAGRLELTRALYDALGEMLDSDQPQGLVRAEDSMQIWLNPAAVGLFQLSSLEKAVPRDTTRDWLPVDLERKRQLIRDVGESSFEIDYSTKIGDGTWRKLVNRYRLVDNRYLIGANISSEVIEVPAGVSP